MSPAAIAALEQLGLATITHVIELIAEAKADKVSVEDVTTQVQKIHDEIAANRAAGLKTLHDRFDKGGTEP